MKTKHLQTIYQGRRVSRSVNTFRGITCFPNAGTLQIEKLVPDDIAHAPHESKFLYSVHPI